MEQHFSALLAGIRYISDIYPAQPDPKLISKYSALNFREYHRLFTDWSGISVKEFVQQLVFLRARHTLRTSQSPFSEATFASIGITILQRRASEKTVLKCSILKSRFGDLLAASTDKGIAALIFIPEEITEPVDSNSASSLLQQYCPYDFIEMGHTEHTAALEKLLLGNNEQELVLHLRCTDFQLQVYKALLLIPFAQLRTYSEISRFIGNPKASRAVGGAVSRNPVSIVIPCHRVVPSSNTFGDYRWGPGRKIALVGWEAVEQCKMAE